MVKKLFQKFFKIPGGDACHHFNFFSIIKFKITKLFNEIRNKLIYYINQNYKINTKIN